MNIEEDVDKILEDPALNEQEFIIDMYKAITKETYTVVQHVWNVSQVTTLKRRDKEINGYKQRVRETIEARGLLERYDEDIQKEILEELGL